MAAAQSCTATRATRSRRYAEALQRRRAFAARQRQQVGLERHVAHATSEAGSRCLIDATYFDTVAYQTVFGLAIRHRIKNR